MFSLSIRDLPVKFHSESEQLRIIRTQSKNLFAHEIDDIQAKLSQDYCFTRLSVEFAKATKNEKYVFEAILGFNPYIISQVVKFPWLYETKDEGFLNRDFIDGTLQIISISAKLKILHKIGKYLNDTELGDQLWNLVCSKSKRLADCLLAACSNDLILREVSSTKYTQISGTQLQSILKKRFESGCDLVEKLMQIHYLKDRNSTMHEADIRSVLHFILKQDLKRGFDLLKKSEFQQKVFGENIARNILKYVQTISAKIEDQSFIIHNSQHLPLKCLKRYASYDLYLRIFVSRFKEDREDDVEAIENFLNHLPNDKKLQHHEELFKIRYNKYIRELPSKVSPFMLHLLSDELRNEIVTSRLRLNDYSSLYWSNKYYESFCARENSDIFWKSLLPLSASFTEFKELIRNEYDQAEREYLYQVLLHAPIIHRNLESFVERLEFVVARMTNEPQAIIAVFGCVFEAVIRFRRIDKRLWKLTEQLVVLLLRCEEGPPIFRLCLLFEEIIKKIEQNDNDFINDLTKIIASEYFIIEDCWVYKIVQRSFVHNDFMRKVLQEREEVLERLREKNPNDFPLEGLYHLIQISEKVNGPQLVAEFPNSLKYLKYLILSPESNINKNQCCKYVYPLIEKQLTVDEANVAAKPKQDFSELRRQIYKNKKIQLDDLDWIVDDDHFDVDMRFLRFVSKIASYSETAKFIEKAISLSKAENKQTLAFKFLAITMSADDFKAQFSFDESRVEVDHQQMDRERGTLLKMIKMLPDLKVTLEMAKQYFEGKYIKESFGALSSCCMRCPTQTMTEFIADKACTSQLKLWIQTFGLYFDYSQ